MSRKRYSLKMAGTTWSRPFDEPWTWSSRRSVPFMRAKNASFGMRSMPCWTIWRHLRMIETRKGRPSIYSTCTGMVEIREMRRV